MNVRTLMANAVFLVLPALLAASAVLALQRMILPLLHWLDDKRPFGTLRPRLPSGGTAS